MDVVGSDDVPVLELCWSHAVSMDDSAISSSGLLSRGLQVADIATDGGQEVGAGHGDVGAAVWEGWHGHGCALDEVGDPQLHFWSAVALLHRSEKWMLWLQCESLRRFSLSYQKHCSSRSACWR